MRVLLIGCGDVGLRMLNCYGKRVNIAATARRADQCAQIRRRAGRPIQHDLDATRTHRLPEALASHVVYMAPPSDGPKDMRLARSLARAALVPPGFGARRLMYTSTSGVFGDSAGRLLTETSVTKAGSARAQRRLGAERQLRGRAGALRYLRRHSYSGLRSGLRQANSIFRVPGIYAADRLPLRRFDTNMPAIEATQDSYSNHIHADDLARILWLGLFRARANRIYIASDGQDLRMGDYFDQVADALQLPRPVRLPASQVREQVSAMMWSFMAESRRLSNERMRRELRIALHYPTVAHTLKQIEHTD